MIFLFNLPKRPNAHDKKINPAFFPFALKLSCTFIFLNVWKGAKTPNKNLNGSEKLLCDLITEGEGGTSSQKRLSVSY